MIERDRNAHRFTLANALKDVSYLAGFAQALGVANPVGAAVRNSLRANRRDRPRRGLCADAVGLCGGVERDVARAEGGWVKSELVQPLIGSCASAARRK